MIIHVKCCYRFWIVSQNFLNVRFFLRTISITRKSHYAVTETQFTPEGNYTLDLSIAALNGMLWKPAPCIRCEFQLRTLETLFWLILIDRFGLQGIRGGCLVWTFTWYKELKASSFNAYISDGVTLLNKSRQCKVNACCDTAGVCVESRSGTLRQNKMLDEPLQGKI